MNGGLRCWERTVHLLMYGCSLHVLAHPQTGFSEEPCERCSLNWCDLRNIGLHNAGLSTCCRNPGKPLDHRSHAPQAYPRLHPKPTDHRIKVTREVELQSLVLMMGRGWVGFIFSGYIENFLL